MGVVKPWKRLGEQIAGCTSVVQSQYTDILGNVVERMKDRIARRRGELV